MSGRADVLGAAWNVSGVFEPARPMRPQPADTHQGQRPMCRAKRPDTRLQANAAASASISLASEGAIHTRIRWCRLHSQIERASCGRGGPYVGMRIRLASKFAGYELPGVLGGFNSGDSEGKGRMVMLSGTEPREYQEFRVWAAIVDTMEVPNGPTQSPSHP